MSPDIVYQGLAKAAEKLAKLEQHSPFEKDAVPVSEIHGAEDCKGLTRAVRGPWALPLEALRRCAALDTF